MTDTFKYIFYRIYDMYALTMKGGYMNMGYQCYGGSCCSSSRGFLTKVEKLEMLQDYKKQLDRESQGVAERIKEIQKASDEDDE